MLDPQRVKTICEARWRPGQRGKRVNSADPLLGDDCSWADMIDVYEGTAVSIVERMMAQASWRKRETIAMRRILDACFRNASEPAHFYAMPLYVSEGILLAFEDRISNGGKWPAGHDEHVLPLAVYASGTRLLADTAGCLPDLRKALVGPICLMTADENRDLETKTHPDPQRPFMRYSGIVQAYRVADGMPVDPETWTFQDHVDHMKTVPAYETGALRYEGGNDMWSAVAARLSTGAASLCGTMR